MAKYRGVLQDSSGNELVPKQDGFYPGDTINMDGVITSGFTTNGGLDMYFQIPLDRPIYATGFNVTYLRIQIRTSNCEYIKDGSTSTPAMGLEVPSSRIGSVSLMSSGIRFIVNAATRWNNQDGTIFNNGVVALYAIISGTFT